MTSLSLNCFNKYESIDDIFEILHKTYHVKLGDVNTIPKDQEHIMEYHYENSSKCIHIELDYVNLDYVDKLQMTVKTMIQKVIYRLLRSATAWMINNKMNTILVCYTLTVSVLIPLYNIYWWYISIINNEYFHNISDLDDMNQIILFWTQTTIIGLIAIVSAMCIIIYLLRFIGIKLLYECLLLLNDDEINKLYYLYDNNMTPSYKLQVINILYESHFVANNDLKNIIVSYLF